VDWNNTKTNYQKDKCFHQLFEQQVEDTPNNIAVVFEENKLTYKELNYKSNQLAHYLQTLGVGPETLVGMCIERSLEMVIGLLGILKAGGAYVPLDPNYPQERLATMLDDSAVPILLTSESTLLVLPKHKGKTVCWEKDSDVINKQSQDNPICGVKAENLAYIIYTSGSTGKPKGTMIPHQGLSSHLSWFTKTFLEEECEGTLVHSSMSFDATIDSLFTPLVVGKKVTLLPEKKEIDALVTALADQNNYSFLDATPSLLDTISQLLPANMSAIKLNTLIFGGEALTEKSLSFWRTCTAETRIYNLYGPTEAIVDSSYYEVDTNNFFTDSVPIGRPTANRQLYILDQYLQPVPIGVVAELYIGGDGLARGYLNRPELTAEKFIDNPFEEGKLYKTGDLARFLPDGNIVFMGRIDHQVKIRGFRIELGEIESVLNQHADIKESVVVSKENKQKDNYLVAYVITNNVGSEISELRAYLAKKLPEYMIPSAFVALETIPLAASGKIDYKALPEADLGSTREDEFVAPRNETEIKLAQIWQAVLGIESVSINDNFFQLGGHSLLATQVMSRLRDTFKVDFPLAEFFKHPTIAELAKCIESEATGKLSGKHSHAPIKILDRTKEIELSFAQERLWLIEQLAPDNTAYNIPLATKITGELDINILKRCLNELVSRHEPLRTSFPVVDGHAFQHIVPELILEIPEYDLSDLGTKERTKKIEEYLHNEAVTPFGLTNGPVIRACLLFTGNNEHILLLTVHHIATDGWSMGILFNELSGLYKAFSQQKPSPLTPLTVQYADFAAWQRQWLKGAVLEEQLDYWREQLAELTTLELPTDRPRPAEQTYSGAEETLTLSGELIRGLEALSQAEGATLFMTLLATFKVLLHRYSGQDDIVVGSPIANRHYSEIENLIGFFVNTLVMRTDVSGNPDFRELLRQVRNNALEAYAHQDTPFEKLVEALQPERDLSRNTLFQVSFALQNFSGMDIELENLSIDPIDDDVHTTHFDLDIYVSQEDSSLSICFVYNTDLFEEKTISRMLEHYRHLLEGIVIDPGCRISELPLLTDKEKNQLLVDWNNTATEYPENICIHELFEQQVKRTPDAIAVVCEGKQSTYQKLDQAANQLARHLLSSGAHSGMLIGIYTERSLEMVIALLGALKAGCAFVPLDPDYPQDRLAFMLEDSGMSMLLTTSHLQDIVSGTDTKVVSLDADCEEIAKESKENLNHPLVPDSLACVIYTSGSTGKPKGVVIQHSSVVNRINWMISTYPFSVDEICCQKTSIHFIDSLWEIFGPLSQGIQLVIIPEQIVKDVPLLIKGLETHQVTRITLVPSLLRALLEWEPNIQDRLPKLKTWITSGETLSVELARYFQQEFPKSILLNLYGSTEVMGDASWHEVRQLKKDAVKVAIGRPIDNTEIFILDSYLQPVPVGVTGELYVSGVGLAQGYLNNKELTAEKFISNPFSDGSGSRLFKTGDLAHYLENGDIQYDGRIDHQVKIRGYRIEPGEIEVALQLHPDVGKAVVIARDDKTGDKRLVAYFVTESQQSVTAGDLRSFLEHALPNYMIPSAFVALETIPLTTSGKIDYKALPEADLGSTREDEFIAPRNETEIKLAQIWQELLGIELIGINDNFFEIGGHSLIGVKLFSYIKNVYGVTLPLATLFVSPTIRGLANLISSDIESEHEQTENVVVLKQGNDETPLFCLYGILLYKDLADSINTDKTICGVYLTEEISVIENENENNDIETFATIDNITRLYLDSIRAYQPEGPYYLCGSSFGGIIALEVARKIIDEGGLVNQVIMLDTLNPDFLTEFTIINKLKRHMKHLKADFLQYTWKMLEQKITCYLNNNSNDSPNDLMDKRAELRDQVLSKYEVENYSGKVLLITSSEFSYFNLEGKNYGWSDFIDDLEVFEAEGDHLGILKKGNVEVIANLLSKKLL
ncbi:MAG: amino acid adenylation domain-containing protein, partial [Gammaproteobacteria bacterium]|nr:amino acid adenylation domain-containing protein [Gammaproteobacteria bacterium]